MASKLPTPPYNGMRSPKDMSLHEIKAEAAPIERWLAVVRSSSGDLLQSDLDQVGRQQARLNALVSARGFR